MKKLRTTILLFFLILVSSHVQAQPPVDWSQLHKEWYINSAGYPSDDVPLDKLYYRLHNFKLDLTKNDQFVMTFRPDSIITGAYTVNQEHLLITFTANGKSETYVFLEMNNDVLSMMADENKTWLFFLNLTSHK
jgi:hypothetical protein